MAKNKNNKNNNGKNNNQQQQNNAEFAEETAALNAKKAAKSNPNKNREQIQEQEF